MDPKREKRYARLLRRMGVLLLPAAAVVRWAAFRNPELTDRLYGQALYPVVSGVLGAVSGLVPLSLAELIVVTIAAAALVVGVRRSVRVRQIGQRSARKPLRTRLAGGLVAVWVLAGALALAFLVSWGFNYARPTLAQRLDLDAADIGAEEVLEVGRRAARAARASYAELGADPGVPTRLPMDFLALDALVDERFTELDLPGDDLDSSPAPAKRPLGSIVMSSLGISGIYVPFTAEPTVNGMLPDVSTPVVLAHEKAHQRGITDEGEANLAAVMVCAGAKDPYLRYAASLYAAGQLIGSAAPYRPEEAGKVWELLGPGPLRDLQEVRDFWARHRGPLWTVARGVNHAYLRTNHVHGGVQSYGRVVRLLVGLDRKGELSLQEPVTKP